MRVQVNIGDDMLKRIDQYSNVMGVSRSALCSVAIGQYIMSLDKAVSILDDVGSNVSEKLKQVIEDETEK